MGFLKAFREFLNGDAAPQTIPRKVWIEDEVKTWEDRAKATEQQLKLTERAVTAVVAIDTGNIKIRALNEMGDLVIHESQKQYEDFSRRCRGQIREQTSRGIKQEINTYVDRLRKAGQKSE